MAISMKTFLLLLSVFLLSSCSQEIPESKVLIRDGIRYHQDTNEPITGTDVSYYDNGQLRQKGNFIAGKKEGLWEVFYENGQLKWRENYKDGNKEGLWELFRGNGPLLFRGNYKNGRKDGLAENYTLNSRMNRMFLTQRENYKDGKLDGIREVFNKNGRLTKAERYKDGVLQK